ncbi:class I mannose-6-phosphate isomerase [Sphingobacterium anhuiense]|uniref:class I mannose-6-phosphate isomerase n=1 Tax=Sphingobacterium anhuiense TaxID=493780 RepID=UPI003C2C40A5
MHTTKDSAIGQYNIMPAFPATGEISSSFQKLVRVLHDNNIRIIDGFVGVDWKFVIGEISKEFKNYDIKPRFIAIDEALLSEEIINNQVAPYLGGNDPLFGKKSPLPLSSYFNAEKLAKFHDMLVNNQEYIIFYGPGAALLDNEASIMYVDLPKSVLIQRMRAGKAWNLGCNNSKDPKQIYKRYYFVDWQALNSHKNSILSRIEIMADQQSDNTLPWIKGSDLRQTLHQMSVNYFRVKPTFESGVWGGQWMKDHLTGIDQSAKNYAWSFEMIVPENGLSLKFNDLLLEISFDQLMFTESKNVLGLAEPRFGVDFPIRFNFLDTFDGGNLSIQCHPSPKYAKSQFGENFTQDETYYIVDRKGDAQVYLGFQDDINKDEFQSALEHSFKTGEAIEVDQYIQKFESKKHELYLIPHGTVHSSGIDNLVLEISATPYNFTFKMYDWVRPDLDGKPRPLNIDRAFDNLNFERKGQVVNDTLIAKPLFHKIDNQATKVHLATHEDHFYDVVRYDFDQEVTIETKNQCHILMLVEGEAVELTTSNGMREVFNYVETFAIPAATGSYTLRNLGKQPAKVIQSYVKDSKCNQF